jgi:hypothetical protein
MGHELRTERELSLDFLRVCEAAAIAAARTMGQGDRNIPIMWPLSDAGSDGHGPDAWPRRHR